MLPLSLRLALVVARQRRFYLFAVAIVPIVTSCQSAPRVVGPIARPVGEFVCGNADYRVFQTLPTLRSLATHVPRSPQTPGQRETLTPGDPLWTLAEQPEVTCSSDSRLVLRFVAAGSQDFASARNRLTLTVAPGGALLDAAAYTRMRALAGALDEALSLLRTKSCSDIGQPCELIRNTDPLRFEGTSLQYSTAAEFQPIGRGAWFAYSMGQSYGVMRAVFTTSDGRFDIEVRTEAMDSPPHASGTFHLVPGLLSREYDQRVIGSGDANAPAKETRGT